MNDNRFYIRAALCSALLCAVSFAAVGCSCREKKEPQNEPPVAENAQNEEEPQFPDYPKDSAKERENESSKDADSDQTQEKNGNHAKEEKYESGEQGETDGNAGNQDGSKGNAGGQGGSNGSAGGQGGSNGSAGGQGGSNGSAGGQGGSNGSAGNDNAESGSQGEKRGKGSKGKEQSQGKNFGGSIGDFFNDFFELGSDSEERSGDDPSDSGVENVQGGAYDDSDYISTGSFNRKRGKRALKDLEKELESAKRSLEREEYEDAFVAANDLISGIREFEYQRLGADGQGKDVDRFKALLKEANQLAEEAGNMIDSVKCSEEAQIFEF